MCVCVGTQQRFVVGARSQCVAKQCVLVATLVQKVVLMAHVRQGKIRGSVVARSTREETWFRGARSTGEERKYTERERENDTEIRRERYGEKTRRREYEGDNDRGRKGERGRERKAELPLRWARNTLNFPACLLWGSSQVSGTEARAFGHH